MKLFGCLLVLCLAQHGWAQDEAFKNAFALFRAGNADEARKVLTEAVHRHPSALDYSLLGSIELQQNDLAAAERDLSTALKLQPGLPGARSTLADVLLALAKLETDRSELKAAEAHWTRAKLLLPRDVRPLLGLARIRNIEGKHEAALALALKAKELAPDDARVLYAVGAVCLEMDLIKDAKLNLERAAELDAANPVTLYALGSAYIATREYAPAIKIFKALQDADASNAQYAYALGTTYYLQGELPEAKQYLKRSVQLLPEQVESYYYLGLIAWQEGETDESVRLLQSVIEKRPAHVQAHISLGQEYRSMDRLEEAEKELETAARIDPGSQKAHYQLGLVLNSLHRSDEAKAQMAMAGKLRDVGNDKVAWQLADRASDGNLESFDAMIKGGHYAQAVEQLTSYTRSHPTSWQAYYQLGYAEFCLHHIQRSVDAICKSLKLNKDYAESHKILAYDVNILGHQDIAMHELTEAIRCDPANVEAHYELGRISYEQGLYLQAQQELEKTKTLAPALIKTYHNLGLVYSAVGQNDKAVENFEQALKLNAQQISPSAWPLIDYATYFNTQNQFEKARDLLLQARQINNSFDQIYSELAKAYRGLNRLDEAIGALRQAIAINKSNASYHYVLARLYTQTRRLPEAQQELAAYEQYKKATP